MGKTIPETFIVTNVAEFKIKMLNWANQFNIFCFLDNQQYSFDNPSFECVLATGCKEKLEIQAGKALASFNNFCASQKGWLFGHVSYDLKNEIEDLTSSNFDGIGFPILHFFVPEFVVKLNEEKISIFCEGDATAVFNAISSCPSSIQKTNKGSLSIQNRLSRNSYIDAIKKLQQHILRGDCYEINFCQEFYAEQAVINPLYTYHQLAQVSPNPFSAFYKMDNKYCLCASPERYIKKTGDRIFSQPIKGTSKRHLQNEALDEKNKQSLLHSEKEKSENVMVVDLVRNDLSKICKEGTVQVDELFGVYSFPQVHQLISTISGELKNNISIADIIKGTFPMGSMTGAPKKRVMELIEQHERTKRGLFSGAIGYIDPQGNFDFNVVIRSILYNSTNQYVSIQAGSAITFYSDAEKEYEECLLKIEAMKKVLESA